MQLPFVMGTELTGIHMGYNERWRARHYEEIIRIEERRNVDLANVKHHLHASNTPYFGVNHDDHCIEISSPKLSSYQEYKQFSIKTRKALADNFYLPKNKHTVCGGAHVHIGLRGFKRMKFELSRDLIMRPYLPWIFGEPDENGAMDVMINRATQFKNYKRALASDSYNYHMRIERLIECLMKPYNHRVDYVTLSDNGFGKDYMFRLCREYSTAEFRFMEMASTWEEQELQLHFICQYMKWMVKRIEKDETTEIKLMTDSAMQAIKPETCVDLFAELCYDIKLNFEDYKPFIRRNLYPRWQDGRERM